MASLFQKVSEQSADKQKRPLGYTVDSYKGVLSALDTARKYGNADIKQVMGVKRTDYTKVLRDGYNEKGFSNDYDSGIWKMELNIVGSCPVMYNNCYDIVNFPPLHDAHKVQQNLGNYNVCPPFLNEEWGKRIRVSDFAVGCCIDIHKYGVEYFNHFYSKSRDFNDNIISRLISGGFLKAQIVFPQKNITLVCSVIGKTPYEKNSCCYLTSPLLGASEWKDCGLSLKIQVNDKDIVKFIPDGEEYSFPCLNNIYKLASSTLDEFDEKSYKKWLERSVDSQYMGAENKKMLKLVPNNLKEAYIKLFIPLEFKSDAKSILPNDCNDRIFLKYEGEVVYEYNTSNDVYDGDVISKMIWVIDKWSTVAGNGGNHTVNYSMPRRPYNLLRNHGLTYNRQPTPNNPTISFSPIFGSENNDYYLDCSSFTSVLLADAGFYKKELQSVDAFNSTEWGTSAVNTINSYLSDTYKAIMIDITDNTKIQTGDILCLTPKERGKSYGHAAMAWVKQDNGHEKVYTLEIGDDDQKNLVILKNRNNRGFYRHLIRIIRK